MIKIKSIAFLIDDEFHKKIKLQATNEDKTIKNYIILLIEKDLEEKNK
jgi:hypothetical protein